MHSSTEKMGISSPNKSLWEKYWKTMLIKSQTAFDRKKND